MKLLINTSNLSVGGGLQVALSFINEIKNIINNNEYHIVMTNKISMQLDIYTFPKNFSFYNISNSPASLKNRKNVIKELNYLEDKINPDLVFTIFTPSYWKPKSTPHLSGFALGWITNPRTLAFEKLSFKQKVKRTLDSLYKKYYVKRDSNYFVVETQDVKNKLTKILNITNQNIFVVGNTYNSFFDEVEFPKYQLIDKKENEFRLITIAHNYPHKNVLIIKDVVNYLKNEYINFKFKFFITIDDASFDTHFHGLEEYVINIGSVESKYCPSLYEQCDALFLPTLLESFTASYPEAMKMKKPILTSDLSFAHYLCEDAAVYFDPLNPKNIAGKIIELSENKELVNQLIQKGTQRLKTFETAKTRAEKYLNICEEIIKKGNKQ